MGEEHAPATATADAHGHDGHGHGHHPAQGHHWDSLDQQIEAGKFGMWLFLATEILLFAGLFCAYAVYRSNHPEIFHHAHFYLSKFWGGVNTLILLLSSFTVAVAVRAASMGNRRQTMIFLALTVVGALGFLGVKAIEYTDKFHHGTLWGARYNPHGPPPGLHEAKQAAAGVKIQPEQLDTVVPTPWDKNPALSSGSTVPKPKLLPEYQTTDGRVTPEALAAGPQTEQEVRNVHLFFGIYFVMTGLHGLHVIIGMIVIIWVMVRTARGEFDAKYYLPVDLAGLYWHLVDLIWIYLFPLLYLIA